MKEIVFALSAAVDNVDSACPNTVFCIEWSGYES